MLIKNAINQPARPCLKSECFFSAEKAPKNHTDFQTAREDIRSDLRRINLPDPFSFSHRTQIEPFTA